MTEDLSTVAKRMKYARLLRRIKQTEAATSFGVSRSTLSQIESGATRTISDLIAAQIDGVYGVSARWVLTGEGDVPIHSTHFHPTPAANEPKNLDDIESSKGAKVTAIMKHLFDLPLEATDVMLTWVEAYSENHKKGG